MNPIALVPPADAVPVAPIWLHLFLNLCFAVHLLLMNLMVGSCLISLFYGFRSPPGADTDPVCRSVAKRLPVVVALAINFGVAALLFVQALYGQFLYVSSQLTAIYWLSVIALLLMAYYTIYLHQHSYPERPALRLPLLALAAVLLLGIAWVFSNNMTLMITPERWARYFIHGDGSLLNLAEPMLIPRYLHFMVASIAVSGLGLALLGHFRQKQDPETGARYAAAGLKWFTYATLLQVGVGFWFQMRLDKEVMLLFMGGSMRHTAVFLLGILLLIQSLCFAVQRNVMATAASAGLLVMVMVTMRDLVRSAYLAPYFSTSDLTVTGQPGPMIMFLIAFGVVGLLVGYAMKAARRTQPSGTTP